MEVYHKIQTVFKRDPANSNKTLLEGEYSLPEFGYLKDNIWVFTEKVNGTNIRIKCEDYQESGKAYGITFGGKSDNAQVPATLITELESKFHSSEARSKIANIFPGGGCLYGEGFGPKIQKGGGNYGDIQDFVLFDVRVGDWWLKRDDVVDVAHKLGLYVVPVRGEGTLHDMVEWAREGIKSEWGDFQAEGLVARPLVELKTRGGDRIITKIKCKDFN